MTARTNGLVAAVLLSGCAGHVTTAASPSESAALPDAHVSRADASLGGELDAAVDARADARDVSGDAARVDVDDLSLRAEVVEADTIQVRSLRAITLDVADLRAKSVRRVDHYPVAKDEGMVRLEGHLVQADRLEAHHVRARVVIADEVVVHRVHPLRGAAPWTTTDGGSSVVNRCVPLGSDRATSARCTRGPF